MDRWDVKPCPGLNLQHGFLQNINQKLMNSRDKMLEEQQGVQRTVSDAKQKRARRPTKEVYSIPARRRGGDPVNQLNSLVRKVNSCPDSDCRRSKGSRLENSMIDTDQACRMNGPAGDTYSRLTPVTQSNCSCTSGNSDFLDTRGSEVKELGKRAINWNATEANIRCLNTDDGVTSNSEAGDVSLAIAKRTLKKLLKKRPKQGHPLYLTTTDKEELAEEPVVLPGDIMSLIVEAIQDPTQVSNSQLQRIASVLVTTSAKSELFSYRMRYIAMFIYQKEKGMAKLGTKDRFVDALLEASHTQKLKSTSASVMTGFPFLNFLTVIYCCDVFHESARTVCADLLCSLIHHYFMGLTQTSQAEHLFLLLRKAAPLLEKDVPTQMARLYGTLKEEFLSESTDELVKDILLDMIEAKAAGWANP